MQGGPRANSGPPPNPDAIRRDSDKASWIALPARREGPAPRWPLTKPTRRELALWAHEWTRPQAVMWEANGQETEVALYVRRLAQAEVPGSPINLGTLVKQQQEALGLSLPGLLRLRWRIAPLDVTAPTRSSVTSEDRAAAKAQLRLLATRPGA